MPEVPVTIGLPVHNGDNYLGAALASLRAQTFVDFRLVISDNASTDGTQDLCRAAADDDPRITYLRQARNLGAAANYNATLARATGPYFLWHAHDDLRDRTALEQLVGALRDHPTAPLAFSRAARLDEHGATTGLLPRPAGLTAADPAVRLHAAITGAHPDVLVFGLHRRAALERTGRHYAFVGGDRLLAAELVLLGRPIELTDPLFGNRDHAARYVRSLERGVTEVERRSWWDTDDVPTVAFDRWRSLRGYHRAVHRYLPPGERRRGHAAVVRALGTNRGYLVKQLLREATVQLGTLARRRAATRRQLSPARRQPR